MILADLLYKLLSIIVLAPLLSILFRGLLAIGGNSVLSDVDIALFFAGPFGWFSLIVLGAVWLGIIALEQASLLGILASTSIGLRLGALDSILFASRHAIPVLRVSGRLIAWSFLVLAPFLVATALIYVWMLGNYDINYYLKERPQEFKIAAVAGVVLAIGWSILFLILYAGWFLALPLVLFDHVDPRSALRESRRLTFGNRHRVIIWIMVWLIVSFAVNTIATLILGRAGQLLIPSTVGSLAVLAGRVGLLLFLLLIAGMAVNVMTVIGFALTLFHGYLEIKPNASDAFYRIRITDARGPRPQWELTRRRVVTANVFGVLFAALVGFTAIRSLRLEDRVDVMAHRGASKVAPENTLASIRQAIQDGANWVEIDVQETADGEVVVIHDSDFMKLAKNSLKVWDATTDALREIDIGSWFDARFTEERIATLADVLKLCRGKLGVIIELKYYGHDEQLEQRVVDIVERLDMADQVMIMSLKPEGVKKMKALRPQWKCGLLMSIAVGNIQRIEADFLAVNVKSATRNFVNQVHRSGKEIYVWTINDAATMSKLMSRGVDGILTDRPELAREVLMHRSQMSSSERMLTEIGEFFGTKQEIGEP